MQTPRLIEVEIGADPPARLDRALARDAPEGAGLSRSRIQALIAAGAVHGPGGPVRDPSAAVPAGARYTLELAAPVPTGAGPEAIALDIRHEDAALIVVEKPAGMVVHPAPGASSGTLAGALLHHCAGALSGIGGAARPGIVHRLDKDTSGLIVAAKTDPAHEALAAQFEARTVERRYLALIHGVPDAGDPRLAGLAGVSFGADGGLTVDAPLGRHPRDRQRRAVRADGRRAVTHLRVIEAFGAPPAAALAECRLETGRTHQIRAHLAHIGHRIIGDPVYGRRRAPARAPGARAAAAAGAFPRQALHGATLGFRHPGTGEWLAFAADMPADMAALLAALRAGE